MATHDSLVPPSFEMALDPGYLGNPKVVNTILGEFIREIHDWIQARQRGEMTAPEMVAKAHERGEAFSAIFSGQDPRYKPIKGWHSPKVGLSQYLKVDLKHYWKQERAKWNDDPFGVCYSWMLWSIWQAMKLDDEQQTAEAVGKYVHLLTRMLTGTVKRL